jgi:hypothetical protein
MFSLPDDITSDPNLEQFKITLQSFSCYNNWSLIKQGSNTVTVNNVAYTLPNGTYTFQKLARKLSTILNQTVLWIQETNQMHFSSNTSQTLRFDNIGLILGFNPDTDYVGIDIESIRPMQPYNNPSILIHLENITSSRLNTIYSNHTGILKECSILGRVFINANPFHLITYSNQNVESDGLFCDENSVGDLKLLITDSEGNEFFDIPEHEVIITIESIDVDDTDTKKILDTMKEVNSNLEKLLMLKVYK